MKLLAALTGLLAGIAVGLAALLFNPLSPTGVPGGGGKNLFDWTPLEFHGAELDAISMLGLPLKKAGKPMIAGTIATANASILVLRNSSGEAAALATRLVSFDEEGDLLRGSLGVNTYTTVFMPNRGSLFLSGYENRWPVLRSNVMSALGQPAMELWPVTVRHHNGTSARIVAGSGSFEKIGGRYTESLRPGVADDGVMNGQIEIQPSFK